MANDLTPMQSFQEKMQDRLRESIADLVPPEVLQTMVRAALKENFEGEPFKKLVRDLLHEHVNGLIRDHVRDQAPQITDRATKMMVALMPEVLGGVIEHVLTGQLHNFMYNDNFMRLIRDRIKNLSY